MRAPLLLGVDIGSASSKGLLATPDGQVVATAQRPHRISLPAPGWAEHDAEQIWWGEFVSLSRELAPQAGDRLAGVCVSGIGPCLLPADEEGRGLRPAILYGIDTRATAEIDELTERFGEAEILARCGSPLTSQSVGPKILWLRRHEPEVWEATRRIFMASSFVVHRLSGAYVLDHHSASQSGPLYDLGAQAWASAWAEVVAPGLALPELKWPSDRAGVVLGGASEVTGIPAGTPVATGTIDAWAEAISVGVRAPGQLMLMYGTTMFMVAPVEPAGAAPDPRLWLTGWVTPDLRSRAAGMATSGAVTEWLRRLTGDPAHETLLRDAAEIPPGAGGLVMLPYFAGERTPLFDADARGLVLGLTLGHERAHLYRAALESTAFGVRHNVDTMAEVGDRPQEVVAVGGGVQGGLWTQIVSDVTGLEQRICEVTIGASYGDALLAGIAAGQVAPDTSWSREDHLVTPNPAHRSTYQALYQLYRELYPATRSAMHRLARLQTGEGEPSSPLARAAPGGGAR
ncbi:MAG: FGGY-family carbohydrate kinase [Candidatus Dormiibacterota bacterium]